MTSLMQTIGDSVKGCTGCANKRNNQKQLDQGKPIDNTLSSGPTDAIDMSDEALEQSEALINMIETAITRRKEKLKDAGVDSGVDMAQLGEVEKALGAAGAPSSTLKAGGLAAAAAGAAVAAGTAVIAGAAVVGGAAAAAGAPAAAAAAAAAGTPAAAAAQADPGVPTAPTEPTDPSQPGTTAVVPSEMPRVAAAADEQAEYEYEYYGDEAEGDRGDYEYSYTYTYREGKGESPTNEENAVIEGLSPDEYEYYYEDAPPERAPSEQAPPEQAPPEEALAAAPTGP